MKIVVYAIAKNEEKFVERWYNSIKEADEIYVVDTGSTDNTVKALKDLNIKVISKKYDNFRFDIARNDALDLVPLDTDICISIDLDEIIEKNWRKKLENIWDKNLNRLKYIYNWKLDENDKPIITYYHEKIHSRKNYKWIYPVHEVLKYNGNDEKIKVTNNITINHYPDPNKSRKSYLSLLNLAYKENPNDERILHYLGREYMYNKNWNKCIKTLLKHIKLSNWKEEKSASMRFISRAYINLKKYDKAKKWLKSSIKETPYLKEPYVEIAFLEYDEKNYNECIKHLKTALLINNNNHYINEPFTKNNVIYSIISACYYKKKEYNIALKYINLSLSIKDEEHARNIKKCIAKELTC